MRRHPLRSPTPQRLLTWGVLFLLLGSKSQSAGAQEDTEGGGEAAIPTVSQPRPNSGVESTWWPSEGFSKPLSYGANARTRPNYLSRIANGYTPEENQVPGYSTDYDRQNQPVNTGAGQLQFLPQPPPDPPAPPKYNREKQMTMLGAIPFPGPPDAAVDAEKDDNYEARRAQQGMPGGTSLRDYAGPVRVANIQPVTIKEPIVTKVAPSVGPLAGGTKIFITGKFLAKDTVADIVAVLVAGSPCTGITQEEGGITPEGDAEEGKAGTASEEDEDEDELTRRRRRRRLLGFFDDFFDNPNWGEDTTNGKDGDGEGKAGKDAAASAEAEDANGKRAAAAGPKKSRLALLGDLKAKAKAQEKNGKASDVRKSIVTKISCTTTRGMQPGAGAVTVTSMTFGQSEARMTGQTSSIPQAGGAGAGTGTGDMAAASASFAKKATKERRHPPSNTFMYLADGSPIPGAGKGNGNCQDGKTEAEMLCKQRTCEGEALSEEAAAQERQGIICRRSPYSEMCAVGDACRDDEAALRGMLHQVETSVRETERALRLDVTKRELEEILDTFYAKVVHEKKSAWAMRLRNLARQGPAHVAARKAKQYVGKQQELWQELHKEYGDRFTDFLVRVQSNRDAQGMPTAPPLGELQLHLHTTGGKGKDTSKAKADGDVHKAAAPSPAPVAEFRGRDITSMATAAVRSDDSYWAGKMEEFERLLGPETGRKCKISEARYYYDNGPRGLAAVEHTEDRPRGILGRIGKALGFGSSSSTQKKKKKKETLDWDPRHEKSQEEQEQDAEAKAEEEPCLDLAKIKLKPVCCAMPSGPQVHLAGRSRTMRRDRCYVSHAGRCEYNTEWRQVIEERSFVDPGNACGKITSYKRCMERHKTPFAAPTEVWDGAAGKYVKSTEQVKCYWTGLTRMSGRCAPMPHMCCDFYDTSSSAGAAEAGKVHACGAKRCSAPMAEGGWRKPRMVPESFGPNATCCAKRREGKGVLGSFGLTRDKCMVSTNAKAGCDEENGYFPVVEDKSFGQEGDNVCCAFWPDGDGDGKCDIDGCGTVHRRPRDPAAFVGKSCCVKRATNLLGGKDTSVVRTKIDSHTGDRLYCDYASGYVDVHPDFAFTDNVTEENAVCCGYYDDVWSGAAEPKAGAIRARLLRLQAEDKLGDSDVLKQLNVVDKKSFGDFLRLFGKKHLCTSPNMTTPPPIEYLSDFDCFCKPGGKFFPDKCVAIKKPSRRTARDSAETNKTFPAPGFYKVRAKYAFPQAGPTTLHDRNKCCGWFPQKRKGRAGRKDCGTAKILERRPAALFRDRVCCSKPSGSAVGRDTCMVPDAGSDCDFRRGWGHVKPQFAFQLSPVVAGPEKMCCNFFDAEHTTNKTNRCGAKKCASTKRGKYDEAFFETLQCCAAPSTDPVGLGLKLSKVSRDRCEVVERNDKNPDMGCAAAMRSGMMPVDAAAAFTGVTKASKNKTHEHACCDFYPGTSRQGTCARRGCATTQLQKREEDFYVGHRCCVKKGDVGRRDRCMAVKMAKDCDADKGWVPLPQEVGIGKTWPPDPRPDVACCGSHMYAPPGASAPTVAPTGVDGTPALGAAAQAKKLEKDGFACGIRKCWQRRDKRDPSLYDFGDKLGGFSCCALKGGWKDGVFNKVSPADSCHVVRGDRCGHHKDLPFGVVRVRGNASFGGPPLDNPRYEKTCCGKWPGTHLKMEPGHLPRFKCQIDGCATELTARRHPSTFMGKACCARRPSLPSGGLANMTKNLLGLRSKHHECKVIDVHVPGPAGRAWEETYGGRGRMPTTCEAVGYETVHPSFSFGQVEDAEVCCGFFPDSFSGSGKCTSKLCATKKTLAYLGDPANVLEENVDINDGNQTGSGNGTHVATAGEHNVSSTVSVSPLKKFSQPPIAARTSKVVKELSPRQLASKNVKPPKGCAVFEKCMACIEGKGKGIFGSDHDCGWNTNPKDGDAPCLKVGAGGTAQVTKSSIKLCPGQNPTPMPTNVDGSVPKTAVRRMAGGGEKSCRDYLDCKRCVLEGKGGKGPFSYKCGWTPNPKAGQAHCKKKGTSGGNGQIVKKTVAQCPAAEDASGGDNRAALAAAAALAVGNEKSCRDYLDCKRCVLEGKGGKGPFSYKCGWTPNPKAGNAHCKKKGTSGGTSEIVTKTAARCPAAEAPSNILTAPSAAAAAVGQEKSCRDYLDCKRCVLEGKGGKGPFSFKCGWTPNPKAGNAHCKKKGTSGVKGEIIKETVAVCPAPERRSIGDALSAGAMSSEKSGGAATGTGIGHAVAEKKPLPSGGDGKSCSTYSASCTYCINEGHGKNLFGFSHTCGWTPNPKAGNAKCKQKGKSGGTGEIVKGGPRQCPAPGGEGEVSVARGTEQSCRDYMDCTRCVAEGHGKSHLGIKSECGWTQNPKPGNAQCKTKNFRAGNEQITRMTKDRCASLLSKEEAAKKEQDAAKDCSDYTDCEGCTSGKVFKDFLGRKYQCGWSFHPKKPRMTGKPHPCMREGTAGKGVDVITHKDAFNCNPDAAEDSPPEPSAPPISEFPPEQRARLQQHYQNANAENAQEHAAPQPSAPPISEFPPDQRARLQQHYQNANAEAAQERAAPQPSAPPNSEFPPEEQAAMRADAAQADEAQAQAQAQADQAQVQAQADEDGEDSGEAGANEGDEEDEDEEEGNKNKAAKSEKKTFFKRPSFSMPSRSGGMSGMSMSMPSLLSFREIRSGSHLMLDNKKRGGIDLTLAGTAVKKRRRSAGAELHSSGLRFATATARVPPPSSPSETDVVLRELDEIEELNGNGN